MRFSILLLLLNIAIASFAQPTPKQLPAKRTQSTIKIDGALDEAAWKEAIPATNFVEWRPSAGKPEDSATRTVVYLLYDNTSVYVGGYCFERTKDSVSRELIGRDKVGINDFVGVILDTYHDKINAVGFYVTPYGEQFDAKYSNTSGEDGSWNAVWDSEAKVWTDGWSFEMRIPYSALRFSNRDNQTWGLNMTRRRNKTGQQFMWNPIDPQVNGFINQEGSWTGIEKIEAPLRLSLSPYLSGYVNHYNPDKKDFRTSVNGGMDVKYGISESFTLDMTLIPDFGQVPTDPQVLNLTPFEVKYDENRAFFTEGTELFNKGNLFYSRRVGAMPLRFGKVEGLRSTHNVVENPTESKLINATKVSGRTKKGLGIGLFNAVTRPMYAVVEDNTTKTRERIQTNPLTNFNIVALDQTLKNNSSVSFINTNVWRRGGDYDANVTAGLFDFNNKKNTYNWNGKVAVNKFLGDSLRKRMGYSHTLGFGKTGGRLNFQVSQEVVDSSYNISDMGYFTMNNYVDHYFWTGYKWTKPGKWFNRMQINYNLGYSRTFKSNQYQRMFTNVNGNVQLKNLWWVGGYVGYNPEANDFYEPHSAGRYFRTSRRLNAEAWFESNWAKKYAYGGSVSYGWHELEKGRSGYYSFYQTYRFSDKFSLKQQSSYQPFRHNVGFDGFDDGEIVFSRRNRITTENTLSGKYNFNNKSGINIKLRHYWSEVENGTYFRLNDDGTLADYDPGSAYDRRHQNFNHFTFYAEYARQFAPGSFIYVVWKNENLNNGSFIDHNYFKNLNRTIEAPHSNNLSVRILYYLDYLDLKKKRL